MGEPMWLNAVHRDSIQHPVAWMRNKEKLAEKRMCHSVPPYSFILCRLGFGCLVLFVFTAPNVSSATSGAVTL